MGMQSLSAFNLCGQRATSDDVKLWLQGAISGYRSEPCDLLFDQCHSYSGQVCR